MKNNKKTLETRLRPESLSRDETPLTSVAHHVANELFKENYERVLDQKTFNLINDGIKYHSSLNMPSRIEGLNKMVVSIIRDTDKIDIMAFFIQSVRTGLINQRLIDHD